MTSPATGAISRREPAGSATDAVGEWESEGGSSGQPEPLAPSAAVSTKALTGTVNQIEWAEQIKERVGRDFDRVAKAMKSVAVKQGDRDRSDTQALIDILEEKRAEVMANDQAGYFIHDWQDPGDQVRQMIMNDPRYETIRASQAARKRAAKGNPR